MKKVYLLPLVLSLSCLEETKNLERKCDPGLIDKRICVTEDRAIGLRERHCLNEGKFEGWSDCKLEDLIVQETDDCTEGKIYIKSCVNDVEILKCISGDFVKIKDCGENLERSDAEVVVVDEVCEDRAIQQGPCENGSEWLKVCQTGIWYNLSDCEDDSVEVKVCEDKTIICGVEGEGIRKLECVRGELVETQECSSPSCEILSEKGENPRISSNNLVFTSENEIKIFDRKKRITDIIRNFNQLGDVEVNEGYLIFVNGNNIIKYNLENGIIGPFIERENNPRIRMDENSIAIYRGRDGNFDRFSSVSLLNGERWNFELQNYGNEFDFNSGNWVYVQGNMI
ncbi:hypothetical protein J4459_03100, partial [Candidatus Woesearchaeota archaeon]|nr:hypothetical protein [Candidatus Woesearchaeota archaeon]